MLKLKTDKLEFRGLSTNQSSKGNTYYLLNVETTDGEAVQFYCKDKPDLTGINKGDSVFVYVSRNRYNDLVFERVVKYDGTAK